MTDGTENNMNRSNGSHMNILSLISSVRLLDRAYAWYRDRHRDAHADHPFWSLIMKWDSVKHEVRQALQQGRPRGCSLSSIDH